MYTPRSDDQDKSIPAYKRSVRAYLLAHDEVASKTDLRAGTDVPAWYIDNIGSTDTFYTSLNQNHDYVASKHIIDQRATHDGFWQPAVDDGVDVFHRHEDTTSTLKHLAFNRPSDSPPLRATTVSTDAVTVLSAHSPTKPAVETTVQRSNRSSRTSMSGTIPTTFRQQ